jgi:hypothetical protein
MKPGPLETVAEQMMRKIGEHACLYESRWTLTALRRVDPELHEAFEEQRTMFHKAALFGDSDDNIREQGEAMCRGWLAVIKRMEEAGTQEDAIMLGQDIATGTTIAIGNQRAAEARVIEQHGSNVVFLTPDEVAAMFAGLQGVAKVKALWPGAEITRVINKYPDEPAQEDA